MKKVFGNVIIAEGGVIPNIHPALLVVEKKSLRRNYVKKPTEECSLTTEPDKLSIEEINLNYNVKNLKTNQTMRIPREIHNQDFLTFLKLKLC